MAKNNFVHLHVHSEYSLLDGLSKTDRLLEHVKNLGMDSLALTDHGSMYGAIEFYKKAKAVAIKPILGMEAYTTNVDLEERPERSKFKNYHLLLLAKDVEGYKNLMKLTSIAHLKGYYYRPRIDRATLKKYSKGLICTSACAQGEIFQAFINEDLNLAKKTANWFLDVFGNDYYLEIQRHKYERFLPDIANQEIKTSVSEMAGNEKSVNKSIIKLSRALGIPIVATNDSHYTKKEHATAQDALVCISTGKNVSDIKRLRFIDTPDFYVKSSEEMAKLYTDLPEAIENTVKIADKCNLELTLGKWLFPKIKLPKGKKADEYLKSLAKNELKNKYKNITPEITKRMDFELKVICSKGYATYFLIYENMAKWSTDNGIPINTRGSVAGSIVSYCLGITSVDPIRYGLPFERFLNPYRPSAPDIDLDIADDKREDMIAYLVEHYGKEKVAQICTFGRMMAKGSVRDVARVLGYPYETGDRISKLIPLGIQGFPMTIERALSESVELRELYDSDVDSKKIIDMARDIEGNARHISVHAAGIVISPTPLQEYAPLQREPSGEKIITQYEMHACEDVGLIKLDVLGIRNLSILRESVVLANKVSKEPIIISEVSLKNKKTFEMLSRGETMGVFQLSSSGMTKYIKDLKPSTIDDLMVMVALYRPGPIAVIPEYIKRKKNPKLVKYLDPRMKKFLSKSYGLLVYQDDLLFCALELAGYDWVEVDKFRKAVGKKIPSEMAKQKIRFEKGIVENGQTVKFAKDLWKLFEPFQAYGFNKAHAASYGMIAYQTAYMKANFPVEFMTALLTAECNDSDKVAAAIAECKRIRIQVLPPDINESEIGFTIIKNEESLNNKAILFGLSAIKNVGGAAIDAILIERNKSKFLNLADFLARVDARKVNKRVLESLIKVGALSSFGNRAQLLESFEDVKSKVVPSSSSKNQQGLFTSDEIEKSAKTGNFTVSSKTEEFGNEELAAFERQLLGFSLSAQPASDLLTNLSIMATHKVGDLKENMHGKKDIRVAVVISNVRVVVTKRTGQEMAFVKATGETGKIDLVVFPSFFASSKELWEENNTLLVSGKVEFRDDSISLLVDKVDTPKDLDLQNSKVLVNIPKNITPSQLSKLKKLLLEHPGNRSVGLVFSNQENILNLNMKIAWDKVLANKIEMLLKRA